MPYTMEDFRRDYAKEHFKDLTPQERLEALKGLPREAKLEAIKEALSPEEKLEAIKEFIPEEVFATLTPEQLEQIRQGLLSGGTSDRPKKRRRR